MENTHEECPFYNDGDSIYIDLGAEKLHLSGETQRIFIEIKCFSEKRIQSELYLALGQVDYYRTFLDELANATLIFMAVPYEAYLSNLNLIFENTLKRNGIGLIVVDTESEEIVEWIK